MAGLNLVCPICTDEFQMQDDVYSTNCGHLYHFSCMQQWGSRSTICPHCRHQSPSAHKIFLLGNPTPTLSPHKEHLEDLKMKLESSIYKINELQSQLDLTEVNFLHMQEQFTREREIKQRIERKLAEYKNNDDNFLSLHAQHSKSEERIKVLLEENDRLAVDVRCKSDEIESKNVEICMLNKLLDTALQGGQVENGNGSSRIKFLEQQNDLLSKKLARKTKEILEQKDKNPASSEIVVKSLKQKLQHITEQLENEITTSTQLAIDKINLQSQIQRMQLQSNNNEQTTNTPQKLRTGTKKKEPNTDRLDITSTVPATKYCVKDNEPNSGVVFQKFPYREIHYPLEELIVSIGSKMNIHLKPKDVLIVRILDKFTSRKLPTTVCIHVVFRKNRLKHCFIAQQQLLKPFFKGIAIKEYVDREINGLFLYAIRKLRGVAFDSITMSNNVVIAKKKSQDENGVVINSREQINELLKKALQLSNNNVQNRISDKIVID
uniref:RING-type domain-containing protein n=1 Tax=Musca domestica TaxID=7370 RepID=A0A1I8MBF5_MUSDO